MTFWREYLILGALSFINSFSIQLSLPFLLGRLLLSFRYKTQKYTWNDLGLAFFMIFSCRMDSDMNHSDALLYATGFIVNIGINVLTSNHYVMVSFHNSMKIKIAVCNLIYRKASFFSFFFYK